MANVWLLSSCTRISDGDIGDAESSGVNGGDLESEA